MPRAVKVAGSEASPEQSFSNDSDNIDRPPLREIIPNTRTTRRQAAIKAKGSTQADPRPTRREQCEAESYADEDDLESLASAVGKYSEQTSLQQTSRSTRTKKTPEAMVDVVNTSTKGKLNPRQNDSPPCKRCATSSARETQLAEREAAVLRREERVATREEAVVTREESVVTREEAVATRESHVATMELALEEERISVERGKEDVAFAKEDVATRLKDVKQFQEEHAEKVERWQRNLEEREQLNYDATIRIECLFPDAEELDRKAKALYEEAETQTKTSASVPAKPCGDPPTLPGGRIKVRCSAYATIAVMMGYYWYPSLLSRKEVMDVLNHLGVQITRLANGPYIFNPKFDDPALDLTDWKELIVDATLMDESKHRGRFRGAQPQISRLGKLLQEEWGFGMDMLEIKCQCRDRYYGASSTLQKKVMESVDRDGDDGDGMHFQ